MFLLLVFRKTFVENHKKKYNELSWVEWRQYLKNIIWKDLKVYRKKTNNRKRNNKKEFSVKGVLKCWKDWSNTWKAVLDWNFVVRT